MSEVDRLTKVYRTYRESDAIQTLWDVQNLGNQAILRERQHKTHQVLNSYGFIPLNRKKILEVGCGTGKTLANLIEFGADAENLYGVDLLPDRIEEARQRYPDLSFQCANAEHLDFPNVFFDLILLFTVFSSILDEGMAGNVAAEVYRVLKRGGVVLWYDIRYNNPNNPNVKGITKNHIKTLFPKLIISLRPITVLPPLARRLGRLTPMIYPVLSIIPFLRTHYLGLFMKSYSSADQAQKLKKNKSIPHFSKNNFQPF
jgi:ubiquinone/menaquinone biosynthesis C-methylase UbiE